MTYQECVEYILSIPMFAGKLGTKDLNRILDIMGHPERSYPVIHVAGTNGKGSTCSFLASILQAAGKKVGVFTSPHLRRINERISVNKTEISDADFVVIFEEVMEHIKKAQLEGISHPSFFEFMFIMAALYFQKQQLDFVIFETGMGGRYDATNVVEPEVSIITSVGLDHMQYLGDSIEKIAAEKAGIIKPDVPVVFFDRKDVATGVIADSCKKTGGILHIVEKEDYILLKITKNVIDFSFKTDYYMYDDLTIRKTALYQIENAMLAIRAYEILVENRIIDFDVDIIKAGLIDMVWPCRMECVCENVYIDGAHNEEAINAFCKTLEVLFPKERKILLFAVSKDKDYEAMIERLCKISFDEVILVRYEGSRSAELEIVEVAFRRFSGSKITSFDDIRTGFLYGKSHVKDRCLFCVGSLYLAGDLLDLGV